MVSSKMFIFQKQWDKASVCEKWKKNDYKIV